jgi:hypothetical protein
MAAVAVAAVEAGAVGTSSQPVIAPIEPTQKAQMGGQAPAATRYAGFEMWMPSTV